MMDAKTTAYVPGRTYHRYKEGAYFLPNDEVRARPLPKRSVVNAALTLAYPKAEKDRYGGSGPALQRSTANGRPR